MRKNIVGQEKGKEKTSGTEWLDLEEVAQVDVTSEDPSQPIEGALQPTGTSGWRAAEPGTQTVRLLFDRPQSLRRIYLLIEERERTRTQELVLRWSADGGRSFREIVRQQYNFSPPGTVTEQEEYEVDLTGVTALELEIVPDLSGGAARASLGRFLIA